MLANEFIRLPYQFVGMIPPAVPRWGKAHKDFMRSCYRRAIAVQGPTQEMPMFDSRVQVDPVVKDYWGIPVARLSGDKHPHTIEIGAFMAGQGGSVAQGSGRGRRPGRNWPVRDSAAGQHQAGTCRMGDDPKTSVVNRYCQVHDIDNLFVIDAQRARDQRRIQSGADDYGDGVSRIGSSGEAMERHPFRMIAKYLWTAAPVLLAVVLMAAGIQHLLQVDGGEGCARVPRNSRSTRNCGASRRTAR